jgi:hypothetical protein
MLKIPLKSYGNPPSWLFMVDRLAASLFATRQSGGVKSDSLDFGMSSQPRISPSQLARFFGQAQRQDSLGRSAHEIP